MKAKALADSPDSPFELALRVRHPSMDPADLSRELGFEPTHSFRAGEPRHPRSDAVAASVHGESYWLGRLDRTSWLSAWLSSFGNLEAPANKLGRAVAWNLGLALTVTTRSLFRSHAPLFERIRREGGQVSLKGVLLLLPGGAFRLQVTQFTLNFRELTGGFAF